MFVLCENDSPSGPYFVRKALANAFVAAGHTFKFWDSSKVPAFDEFYDKKPDIFIGTTYGLSRALIKCIVRNPNMKVVLFGNYYGDVNETIDKESYPLGFATEQEVEILHLLYEEFGKPDCIYIHHTDDTIKKTMNKWKPKVISLLNCADMIEFAQLDKPPMRDTEETLDCSFVGGKWGYKSRNIDRTIVRLCYPSYNYKIQIYGNSVWGGIVNYLGPISSRDIVPLYNRTKICLNVSEPHSTDLGWDVVTRPFNVLASRNFCLSDTVAEARALFTEDELPFYTVDNLEEVFKEWLNKPKERQEVADRGFERVRREHTNFHRVSKLLRELGMEEESEGILAKGRELDYVV